MNVTATVANTALACGLVEQGMGVTIADALTAQSSTATCSVPLTPEQTTEFGLMYPRDRTISADATMLADAIAATAQDLAQRF